MYEEEVDTGFLSFLMNSNLFSITNSDAKVIYFNRIILFPDEEYVFKLISGSYQTKELTCKINQLSKSDFFDDDKLMENLLKNKNIKISMRLKISGESRSGVEERLSLNNPDDHATKLLNRFLQRIKDLQLEKNLNVFRYYDLLKIPYYQTDTKDDLISNFKKINVSHLGIPKDILYMDILFNNAVGYLRDINKDFEKIINKTENSYNQIKEEMKILDYKLRAKYIIIKQNNSK